MKDIEKRVLHMIAENVSSPDVHADTDTGITSVRDSINDAIQEVCMVTNSYTRLFHLVMSEGKYVYDIDMTDDYMGYVLQAWNREKHWELEKTDPMSIITQDPNWLDSGHRGTQYKFFPVGFSQVGFWLVPLTNNNVIELKVVAIPKPYTDADDPVRVRLGWEDAVVNFAVSEQFASRGDGNRAAEYYTKYLTAIGMMKLHPEYAERQYSVGAYRGRQWVNRSMSR